MEYYSEHLDVDGEMTISKYIEHLQGALERFGDLPVVIQKDDVYHIPIGTLLTRMKFDNDCFYSFSPHSRHQVLIIDS